jgi:hypothetical protein
VSLWWQSGEHSGDELDPAPSERGRVVLDIRGTTQSVQQRVCLAVIDALVTLDVRDDLVIVADYELTGLSYELDLRHQTRGLFEYSCEQRSDGAWACLVRRSWRS